MQIPLRGLLALIAFVALALGLGRSIGYFPAIAIVAFVFVVCGERLLAMPSADGDRSQALSGAGRGVLILTAAAGVAAAATQSILGHAPGLTVTSPFPLLSVLTFLVAEDFYRPAEYAHFVALAACSAATFLLTSLDLCRKKSDYPIPLAVRVIALVAVMLSIIWFGLILYDGELLQGKQYTYSLMAINGAAVGLLWGYKSLVARKASFTRRIAFGAILHYWLFWFAFPWLGESL